MGKTKVWRILLIDDDEGVCSQVKEILEGERVSEDQFPRVETCTAFEDAVEVLESRRIDLVILDVRLGPHGEEHEEDAGVAALGALRERRFLPVVFYTGLPHLVRHLQTSLVTVVDKGAGADSLVDAVRAAFASGLPKVNRALFRHIETVQRSYMWEFVAGHWADFADATDRASLAYMLARRLAAHLATLGIEDLARELGDTSRPRVASGLVHPMQYYVMPPIAPFPLEGDILRENAEADQYWLLLTPTCDMVPPREKAERVLLARCLDLSSQPEYDDWKSELPEPSGSITRRLVSLLSNNRDGGQRERFFFLPGALDLPDLLADFQDLRMVPLEGLKHVGRVASLDSPYAEALLARFGRYIGRLGTPDLDVQVVLDRLRD